MTGRNNRFTGGLIAIGIFLMQWDPASCLERFEKLATTTFLGQGQKEKISFSQKLQQTFHAWLNDHRYNLSPIERAFHSNSFAKMFNPLQNDTKVAVTATSVRANVPCIIGNYNGGPRSDDNSKFSPRTRSSVALTKGKITLTFVLLATTTI
jgi:hypothetical protein